MSFDSNRPPSNPGPAPIPVDRQWSPRDPMWVEETEPDVNFMEYVHLVWGRKWLVLAVLVAVVVLAGAWSMTRPKMYRATSKITLHPAPQLSQNQFDMMMSWWQMDRFLADQVHVLKTRELAQRVVDRLGLDSHPEFMGGDAAAALGARLDAKPIEQSFVITVSMVGLDPETTSEWLNVYIDEYVDANIESSLERTRQVYEVIQSRLDPLRMKMAESELAIMAYQEEQTDLLFADEDQNVISEQIKKLTTEYAQTKADRIRIETKLNALRRLQANFDAGSFPEILQDPTIQRLREQRNEIQVDLTDKLRSLKEGHPAIQELRSRLASVNVGMQAQVVSISNSLQTDFDIVSRRERSLYENIQALKDESIDLSKQRLEFERLGREYQQNKAFFEEMLARSKDADISSTTAVNNVRIIEPATPPGGPYTPNVKRTVLVAIVLGLFFGVGLVLFIDFLDHTLRTPEQVERYLQHEVLATLPKFTEERARSLREAFQSLRTALLLAARGEGCQIVMVTSSLPEEGKTTVAFNLSKVLASGGARVLLVDADLRKPRTHRIIKAKNVRGLTSVVLGEREMPEVLHSIADVPNLDLITSGPLPPNPPELFGKASFRNMLDLARQTYDWVIVDTPPVASVTDPVMCARVMDMVVLVVQYGGPKRQIVQEAVRLLSRTGVRVAGVLLNKVDIERDSYYYSGYYSYYNYGEEPKRSKRKKRAKAG